MSDQLGNNYPNPLDEYRSYSYHFIFTVASTTESLRKLVGADNGKANILSAVDGVLIGEPLKIDNSSAYLLLDSRRFSQYSITDVEFEHVYGTGDRINPAVPTGRVGIKITDVTGLSFFNLLMDTFRNRLKTTRASAFFLLSIVFVGHKDNDTSDHISTCSIPLNLVEMDFEFTSSGSLFNMSFIETEGAAARGTSSERMNYLGDTKTISTKGQANNLGGMFSALEDKLNVQSLETFQKYQNSAFKDSGIKGQKGKLVQYMITVPAEWQEYKLTTAATSKRREMLHVAQRAKGVKIDGFISKDNSTQSKVDVADAYSTITFAETTTITDAIKAILESAEEILTMASEEKRLVGQAKAFKIVTVTTSDDATYTLHFDIYPFQIPKDDPKDNVVAVGTSNKTPVGSGGKLKNFITYDYLFTGKNSHIDNLKIHYSPLSATALDTNLQIGQARQANLAEAGQVKANVDERVKGAPVTQSNQQELRPGDPIFIPIKSKDQKSNNASQKTEDKGIDVATNLYKAKQEYDQTYAYLHFISSLMLEMQIRGNPNIIRKYADRDERGGVPPHATIITVAQMLALENNDKTTAESNYQKIVKPGFKTSKAEYVKTFTDPRIKSSQSSSTGKDTLVQNGADIATYPVFVKLNILAPNVDFTGEFKQGEAMFTDKFFYNGIYQILKIKTSFNGGTFRHALTMNPYDVAGTYSSSNDGPNNPSVLAERKGK